MAKVGSMRQGKYESTKDYAASFQKLRRQAGYQDGVQLVVVFWVSLRDSIQRASLTTTASRYGSSLHKKLEEMIKLVCATGEDSSLLTSSASHSKSSQMNNPSKRLRTEDYGHENKGASKTPPQKHLNNQDGPRSSSVASQKPCHFCQNPWFNGHRCKAFFEHKKATANKNKRNELVSRMALQSRANQMNVDELEMNGDLDRMAIKCKLNHTKSNEYGINITFPIILNDQRTLSLLGSGADFSSIDLKYCQNNSIKGFLLVIIKKILLTIIL